MEKKPRSIIYYFGGSGGDFLRGLCEEQTTGISFSINSRGKVRGHNAFRHRYTIERKDDVPEEVLEASVVETSHVLQQHPMFGNPDLLWYYIHVEARLCKTVASVMFHKRLIDTPSQWRSEEPTVSAIMEREYGPVNDMDQLTTIFAADMQLGYSLVPATVKRLDFINLFDVSKTKDMVEDLTGVGIRDHQLFERSWQRWITLNQYFKEALRKDLGDDADF